MKAPQLDLDRELGFVRAPGRPASENALNIELATRYAERHLHGELMDNLVVEAASDLSRWDLDDIKSGEPVGANAIREWIVEQKRRLQVELAVRLHARAAELFVAPEVEWQWGDEYPELRAEQFSEAHEKQLQVALSLAVAELADEGYTAKYLQEALRRLDEVPGVAECGDAQGSDPSEAATTPRQPAAHMRLGNW